MSLGVYILRTHDLLVAAAGFSKVSLHAATVLSELGEALLDSAAFRFKGTQAPVCFGDGLVGFLQVIFGSFVFCLPCCGLYAVYLASAWSGLRGCPEAKVWKRCGVDGRRNL